MNDTILRVLFVGLFIVVGSQIGCLVYILRRVNELIDSHEKRFRQLGYALEQGSIDIEEYVDDRLTQMRSRYEESTDEDEWSV